MGNGRRTPVHGDNAAQGEHLRADMQAVIKKAKDVTGESFFGMVGLGRRLYSFGVFTA